MFQVDANKHTLAKYLMELTITDYDLVHYHPSQIAAAALCLSMKTLDNLEWVSSEIRLYDYLNKNVIPVKILAVACVRCSALD